MKFLVFRLATVFSCSIIMSACTYTMVGNAPKTELSKAQSKTINASFAKSEQFKNLCDDPDQDIAAIRFHTNPAYLIASLVSFGLYVPQHITWWCGEQEPECEEGDDSEECEIYIPGDN